MKKFVIRGGRALRGEVSVSGSKNAALPILLAALSVFGTSVISGVPKIGDTEVALELLRDLGATVTRQGDTVRINTDSAAFRVPSCEAVAKIRASTYLIGASLARFGEAHILKFGGCGFCERPIDLHIYAAKALGARVEGERMCTDGLRGGEINFRVPSVGATVNALIMAASAVGESVIRGYAREPHVLSLIDFLVSAGAKISLTEHEIRVTGSHLSSGVAQIRGDMIEAGSYLAAAVMTGGELTVTGAPHGELSAYLDFLAALGADPACRGDRVSLGRIKSPRYTTLTAAPYPAYPTDLQPIAAPMLAALAGGKITDTVWESRFGYLDALESFGIRSHKFHSGAEIYPSKIIPATVTSPDLRGGMACVLSALAADGESVIYAADTVLRGYESIEEKLRAVGADISVVD